MKTWFAILFIVAVFPTYIVSPSREAVKAPVLVASLSMDKHQSRPAKRPHQSLAQQAACAAVGGTPHAPVCGGLCAVGLCDLDADTLRCMCL